MITRRKVLLGSHGRGSSRDFAVGIADVEGLAAFHSRQFCGASRRVRLSYAYIRRSAAIPVVFGPHYTPESASMPEMRALHRALHTDRVVIVNPSVYGADNSCTLDAVKQLGPRARAVAVIDDKTSAGAAR